MLDPFELVKQAKNRHYAYKPLSASQEILGEGYTPSVLQGRDITKNPAGAAALAAQGVHGANTPQVRPNSPLNSVEPTANGQPLPGYAGGGEVLSKVSKIIQDLLKRFGSTALPSDVADASHEATGQLPSAQERLRRAGSQLNPGGDPYNTADEFAKQHEAEEILGTLPSGDHRVPESMLLQPDFLSQRQAFAEGGSTDSSSLKWIADMSRKLGIDSYADDRARVATGIAKQFYGLDEHNHPKLGGEAWLKSQHGTPPRILDEMTAIPGDLARLMNSIFGGKIPANANISPEQRRAMEREIPVPKWSDDAASRVSAFDQAAEKETGVGQAYSLPEHVEDAAGMLATPFPASKVAGEAPTLQRLFEYMTPVRPPTLGRYATDSAMLGGVGTGLDKLVDRLSAKTKSKDTSVDPEFEQTAIDSTNQGYAGGGKILDLTSRLAELASKAKEVVPKETPATVSDLSAPRAQKELSDFSKDFHNKVQQRALDQQSMIQQLGHKHQVGDKVSGSIPDKVYEILGLAGTKAMPTDIERLKAATTPEEISAVSKALRQEKINRPWGPAYFLGSDVGERFTMPEWGIQKVYKGPQEVSGPQADAPSLPEE